MFRVPISTAALRLARWLEDALSTNNATADAPGAGGPDGDSGTGPTGSGGLPSAGLQKRLRGLLRRRPDAPTACLHMLGLEALQVRLGARWPKAAERVRLLVEHLLAAALDADDVWFRFDDEHYVIVFAHLDKDAAQAACAALVEQIHTLLLGDPDLTGIGFDTVIVAMHGPAGLRTSMEHTILGDLNPRLKAPADCDHPSGPEAPIVVRTPAPAKDDVPPGVLSLLYTPVWDMRNQAITTYVVTPRRTLSPGWTEDGYRAATGQGNPDGLLALDRYVLAEALDVLADLRRNRFRLFLTVPVHCESLSHTARRMSWLEGCRAISPGLRDALIFVIHGLPEGTPGGRLSELVALLKPHCRTVGVHSDLSRIDPALYAGCGIGLVGAVAPPALQQAGHTAQVARLAGHLAKWRLRFYLGDVQLPETALAFEKAGVDFVYGPAIGAAQDVPEHMLRFTDSDVRARIDA